MKEYVKIGWIAFKALSNLRLSTKWRHDVRARTLGASSLDTEIRQALGKRNDYRRALPDLVSELARSASEERLAGTIRSILGPLNDDDRTVPDLIDDMVGRLIEKDGQTQICCQCLSFNGSIAATCHGCGAPL